MLMEIFQSVDEVRRSCDGAAQLGTGRSSPAPGDARTVRRGDSSAIELAKESKMSDLVEYPPGGEFRGVIGRTVQESSPAWPVLPRAKDGAPNVLFFVLDDVGYGQLNC